MQNKLRKPMLDMWVGIEITLVALNLLSHTRKERYSRS